MALERIRHVDIEAISPSGHSRREDQVAAEEPLEIRIDGEPLAVVMRTPGDDIDLAAGFLHAEQIVRDPDHIATIEHCKSGDDPNLENIIDVRLAEERRSDAESLLSLRKAERATITSASCGVCGKKTIESLFMTTEPFAASPIMDPDFISQLPNKLRESQRVFSATGGLHAAGIFDPKGALLVIREDVGRHNAVDKCIGHLLLREALPIEGATLMVSGRTSFEIIQKALIAGIQTVAAVSAPSSLAVELAKDSKMGLCGFVRDGGLNAYAGSLSRR